MSQSESESSTSLLDPTLKNIVVSKTLKWIFVGGKGGVGKTTTSCALATHLAQTRKKVLLISTDPAHNIADTFAQPIKKTETLINGFNNLYAMEIDSKKGVEDMFRDSEIKLLSDLIASIPGIDEAISFSELMKSVDRMIYDIIIFDTAPTGHTLKLLGFPSLLEKGIEKLISVRNRFSGIFSSITNLVNKDDQSVSTENMLSRLESVKQVAEKVNIQFRDKKKTTFICVCIPEFLSLYETDRLLKELDEFRIDSHCIVVNQVLFPEKNSKCKKCISRVKMQRKYLEQINDLYEDYFHIVTTPLLDEEVRGIKLIKEFGNHLMIPYL